MGSRHPGPTLKVFSSRSHFGPRPRSSRRQGRPPGRTSSKRENLSSGSLHETTRGVRGARRRGLFRRESPRRAFASGPRPMSHIGQSPVCSGILQARLRSTRVHASCPRKWSLARATAERLVVEKVAEGMAPRSGADHARNDLVGSDELRVAGSNADRGGNLARRRIESSYGCARASIDTAEIGESGFGPHDVCPSGVHATSNGNRGQGLAFAGTPRALPSGRARAGDCEGKSSMFEEAYPPRTSRFETKWFERITSLPRPKAGRSKALEPTPVEGVSGNQSHASCHDDAGGSCLGGSGEGRSAARPRSRAGTTTETSEVKVATKQTSEQLVRHRAVPPKRTPSA